MANFQSLLKNGGGTLGRLAVSAITMFLGKKIADKMSRKALREQTGFETTEEIMADAQAKAEKARAEAEKAQAEALAQAQAYYKNLPEQPSQAQD